MGRLGEEFCWETKMVSHVKYRSNSSDLPYETIFQLTSPVHTQKITYPFEDLLFGSESETSNYVGKKFGAYASDILRVNFC